MIRAIFFAAIYGWIGFTVGYFFRKWLETRWVPRFREQGGVEMVDWIDEADRRLDTLSRAEIRRGNLLHRVTATFVFHPDGRLFVQQRTLSKDVYPGLFDVCVGGTVAAGETFEQNACREIAEELGIRGAPVYPLFGHRFTDASTNSLIRVFACVHGGPIKLQAEEVEGGEWTDPGRVPGLIATGKVCPDSVQGWTLYRERHGAANFAREIAPHLQAVPCEA